MTDHAGGEKVDIEKSLAESLAAVDAMTQLPVFERETRKFVLRAVHAFQEAEDPCIVCGDHPMPRLTLLNAALASTIDHVKGDVGPIRWLMGESTDLATAFLHRIVGCLVMAGFRIVYDPDKEISALTKEALDDVADDPAKAAAHAASHAAQAG